MLPWQRKRLWRTLLALLGFLGILLYAWSLRPVHTPAVRPPGAHIDVLEDVSTAPWTITPLADSSYLPALLRDLGEAHHTIDVAMYVIREHGKGSVDLVLDALEGAVRRGVRVRVLLDRSPGGRDRHDLFNLAAASRLQKARVAVRFDRPEVELHDKLVLIDERIAFLGAHNWTPDALLENHELSLRAASEEPLTEAVASFGERWADGIDPGRVDARPPSGTDVIVEAEE